MRALCIYIAIIVCLPLYIKADDGGFNFLRNRRSITLPIQVRNNLAVVPLHINNHGPFYFILDTGVRTSILTEPMLAYLLGLEFHETIYIYGLGGEGIVEALLARGVDIRMHGIRGKNMNLIVIPEDILMFSEIFGFPVYGVIGYDFFSRFPVEISYSNERMRVFNTSNYRVGRRSHVVPFQLVNGKPYVSATIVGENGDSLTTTLLLDLGASHPVYLNRNNIGLSDRTLKSFIGKGISGNLMGEIGRANKLILGDVAIDNPLIFYPDREFLVFNDREIHWEGLIGGAIFKRFNVIVDYSNEQMILRPGRGISRPFQTSLSGLEIIADGSSLRRFVVHYVRPGSVAYEAGILGGDQIIQLNHMNRRDLNMEEILDILSLREGYPISITINRNGLILRKQFNLREDLQ